MAENEKYILQSVANALDILDLLTAYEELSVPEIAKKSGLSKSSVFRLLATLEDRRFVSKTENARYRLDIKLVAIGTVVRNRMEIIRYAHPHLIELTKISGETSHLVIWDRGTNVRFIDKVISTSTIHTDSRVGFCRAAHLLGCGKVLLAYKSQKFQQAYMDMADFTPLTPNTIVDADRLRTELERIQRNGYACDMEESEQGLVCFAAPVRDFTGNVVAAISISGPAQRMLENQARNLNLIQQTARDISHTIADPH